jgi:hypothetical protein
MTSTIFRRLSLFALALSLAAPSALASSPVYYELGTRAAIEKGEASGISIADTGTLTLAPTFESVYDTEQTFIWSVVADAKGTLYLGTGGEGRIYAVAPNGVGRVLADTEELHVTALAVDPASGALYAATSPDGRIYRVGADGALSVFFDPEEKYVWSLAYRDGALYAGTGEAGIVYRITASGQGEAWVDTDEVHVVSLAFTPSGDLLAGTDPNSLLLRIGKDGKPFTLLDTPLQETHEVAVGPDGSVYALAIASSAATTNTEGGSVSVSASSTTTAQKPDIASIGTTTVAGRRDIDDAKSAVFRVLPDGSSDVVWSSKTIVGYAMHPEKGRLLVGTGDRGRVLAVDSGSLQSTVLVQSTEDQTSRIFNVGGTLYATSNNLGKLFRVGPGTNATGTYVSPVHDAKSVSTWGRVVLRSAGTVTVETRSGNTETPDSTWSPWAPVRLDGASGSITSPPARYLQWRLALSGANARVQSTAVSYLPRNVAPEVTLLEVLPSGIGLQELPQQPVDPGIANSGFDPSIFGFATNLPPRKIFQKGARSMIWQAKDPDDDRLTYSLFYRGINDSAWHQLAGSLSATYYTIDSDALPDGVYIFRLVADDSPSNPAPFNRTGERVTEPLEIDNTPPAIVPGQPSVSAGTVEVVFTVEDRTSRITRAEYSLDGGAWLPVYPEDGIADGPREAFRVRLTGVPAGEHVLALRAADSSTSIGSGKVTVTVR